MKLLEIAKQAGWEVVKSRDPYLTSFSKKTSRGPTRINIWRNDRSNLFTVGTYLNHPKQGKTQLFRKHCDLLELKKLLENPRLHTGKGYR